MRAFKFITGHVIYNPAYTYKFQLKTTILRRNLMLMYCDFFCQNNNIFYRWFLVGICKYKPGYKSHDLLSIRVLSLVEITAFRLPSKSCKRFFLNKFSTNEST